MNGRESLGQSFAKKSSKRPFVDTFRSIIHSRHFPFIWRLWESMRLWISWQGNRSVGIYCCRKETVFSLGLDVKLWRFLITCLLCGSVSLSGSSSCRIDFLTVFLSILKAISYILASYFLILNFNEFFKIWIMYFKAKFVELPTHHK